MPRYEYKCKCGKTVDAFRSYEKRDEKLECECGKNMKRCVSKFNTAGFDNFGRSIK